MFAETGYSSLVTFKLDSELTKQYKNPCPVPPNLVYTSSLIQSKLPITLTIYKMVKTLVRYSLFCSNVRLTIHSMLTIKRLSMSAMTIGLPMIIMGMVKS